MNITSDKEGTELEAEVDSDINDFDAWLQKHVDSEPLIHVEKSIIKTYLNYHLVAKKKSL